MTTSERIGTVLLIVGAMTTAYFTFRSSPADGYSLVAVLVPLLTGLWLIRPKGVRPRTVPNGPKFASRTQRVVTRVLLTGGMLLSSIQLMVIRKACLPLIGAAVPMMLLGIYLLWRETKLAIAVIHAQTEAEIARIRAESSKPI